MEAKVIQHNKPTIGAEEMAAVGEVIKSGWLVQGERTKEFEDNFCRFIGLPNRFAAACCNGTSALYVSLKTLGVGAGDKVIIPTYVCTSLLNAVYLAGAEPVVADVGLKDFNLSLDTIKARQDKNTKAVILPHMFGVPADVDAIKLALDFPVIEDCATAIGSRIGERHAGTLTEMSIFSFYASKMIATGQGGMVVSTDEKLIARARDFIDFDLGKGEKRGERKYRLRFNLEITDMQSAMGIAQLDKISNFLARRKQIARAYKEICRAKGWDYQKPVKENLRPNNYRFVLKSDHETIRSLQKYLKEKGINTIVPIENWELLHNFLGLDKNDFRNAESISRETLSLPIYPSLGEKELNTIVSALNSY